MIVYDVFLRTHTMTGELGSDIPRTPASKITAQKEKRKRKRKRAQLELMICGIIRKRRKSNPLIRINSKFLELYKT